MKLYASDPILLTGDSFYLLDSEFDAEEDEMENELRFLKHDAVIHDDSWDEDELETIN